MSIPLELRAKIAENPFMKVCIYTRSDAPNHDCRGRITWEHAYLYKGKSLQEEALIVPCCQAHNSGESMVKSYNRYRAIIRANVEELQIKYPKINWMQEFTYLTGIYADNSWQDSKQEKL